MSNEIITPADSLRLIGEMINKARVNIASGARYFLLWGWAACAACIAQFILQRAGYPRPDLVWLVMPLCGVISFFMLGNDSRKTRVRTYVEDGMGYLWTGMGISFAVLVLIFMKAGWSYSMPLFILLYATGTFISGRLLRFKIMTGGAIASYLIAGGSVWLPLEYHPLAGAIALLACYIIPGHLLKSQKS